MGIAYLTRNSLLKLCTFVIGSGIILAGSVLLPPDYLNLHL
jgi:hypothetical protein